MAETVLGKKWEAVFKATWIKQFPGTFAFRLHDNMNGYKETSGNPCDFLCYPGNRLYMVECKEHKGMSIPFTAIIQYQRLLAFKDLMNVSPGVIVWFSEKDIVIWVSIYEMEKMVKDGKKSISLKMLDDDSYNIITIPQNPNTKNRKFPDCDFTCLLNLKDGE